LILGAKIAKITNNSLFLPKKQFPIPISSPLTHEKSPIAINATGLKKIMEGGEIGSDCDVSQPLMFFRSNN
jgi:hypothetical protein